MNVSVNDAAIDVAVTGGISASVTDGDVAVTSSGENITVAITDSNIVVNVVSETISVAVSGSDIDVAVSETCIGGPGGGGTSDHAALTHLGFAESGHTGFAGIAVANTFSEAQTIIAPEPAITVLGDSYLPNSDFATNLDGWNVDIPEAVEVAPGGGLKHTSGNDDDGYMYQSLLVQIGTYWKLEILLLSSPTTGHVSFEVSGIGVVEWNDSNPIVTIFGFASSESHDAYITMSADFDGVVAVSMKEISVERSPVFKAGAMGPTSNALEVSSDGLVEAKRFSTALADVNTQSGNKLLYGFATIGNLITDNLRIEQSPTPESIVCDSTIIVNIAGVDYKIPCVAA